MDEFEDSSDGSIDESKGKINESAANKSQESDKTLPASKNKPDNDEETISEGSISEHITSTSGSVEHDRSFQEIEILNQASALVNIPSLEDRISQEAKPNYSVTDSLSSNSLHFVMENDKVKVPSMNGEGTKNAKSILEEILGQSQFHSEIENTHTNSKEDSFNVFANVDFSDNSLINLPSNNEVSLNEKNLFASNFELPFENTAETQEEQSDDVEKRVKGLEEIITVKESTINALTQELDSFREISNNTYTSSMVSATEYKQLQEECHNKLMEYNSAIIYKNDLIQQLSESLDQSVSERKELLVQVEHFKEEIAQLQTKLQETSKMVADHQCNVLEKNVQNSEFAQSDDDDNECSKIEDNSEILWKENVLKLESEIRDLKQKMVSDKEEYETEITRLRDLLENIKCGSTELMELKNELEKKHAKEVEELRMYFEKKCAELEKNYSEEIFSQQSRKMSGSSSDVELSTDFLLSNQPGPGGDHNKILRTKEDVEKLKENLTSFLNKVSKHSLEDISHRELANIETEVKNELNTLLKIGEKLEIKAIESKYVEEISNLKYQLNEGSRGNNNISVSSAIQEVGSSGDFEINEFIESYERRLQEQITLAKIDIMNALEEQIQRLVSNEADDEEEWPSELLQLRDRFTDRYEMEIQSLKEEHETEIAKLKEEHLKILNGALDRARRRSLREGESLSKGEMELLRERDNLKKQVLSLRNLLSELVKYFTQAEDALNNTLVGELLKQGIDKNLTQLEDELYLDSSSATNSSKVFDSLANITRVHLTPNFGELINLIENHSQDADESKDISIDVKNELGMCLEKLRQDANAILALTTSMPKNQNGGSPRNNVEEKLSLVSKQLLAETQQKERLKDEMKEASEVIAMLEKEKDSLENRIDGLLEKIHIMEDDLDKARYKIAELIESGHKEIVSEGYGEEGSAALHELGDTMTLLVDLQEKARTMMAHSRASADPNVLQLIEELCRVGEKIKEEDKKEKNDLAQQIEVADKKYKTTQKFLEEQAMERELERDESQKKIEDLYEQLRERDKDRANFEILSNEHHMKFCCRELEVEAKQAEHLEQQLHDMTKLLNDEHLKYKELHDERNEAVEKILILRDIIRDLEAQNDAKAREIEDHLRNVEKLECIVNQQHKSIDEFELFDSFGNVSDIQVLRRHIEDLEQEVQQLRIGAELAGSEGVVRQIKLQLFEIEVSLDKKTKDLELLHSTGTNSCSSPSEDMSVRDLIRPQTPTTVAMDECEVPLQQLARLKEKLVRHSRAEDAAIKRIRDLEMQHFSLKSEVEESQNEKEYMKRQLHEQLVLISDLQIRLDEQRIKAEHIEKQTNTSLESKIYDLQNEILNLQEKLRSKDKAINHQEQVIKETQQRLYDAEKDIATVKDDEILVGMQKELEELRMENEQIKAKFCTDSQILPNLVENIISDKNADIEKLREKINEMEKVLYGYTSLNLDKNDFQILTNLKNAGGSLEQVISILDLSRNQPVDPMRRCDNSRSDDLSGLHHVSYKKSDDTDFMGSSSEPEISSIEKIGPSNLHYTFAAPLGKPNSTELGKSSEKRVHFEEPHNMEKLTNEIAALQKELESRNQKIEDLENKLSILNEFEDKISKLQKRLDETEQALTEATKTFEKEQDEAREKEQMLGVSLAEKKLHLSEREKEIEALKQDSVRKDEMYFKLAKEKRDLEQSLSAFKRDSFQNLDTMISNKNAVIQNLRETQANSLEEFEKIKDDLDKKKAELDSLNGQVDILSQEKVVLEDLLKQGHEENSKLRKELANKGMAIENVATEARNWREVIEDKERTLKEFQAALNSREKVIEELRNSLTKKDALVIDKDCDIEILNEDLKHYQNQVIELENRVKDLQKPGNNRPVKQDTAKLSDLTKELAHLQDLVREKDRVIAQMTEDHDQVHSNLKAIDNKIKETGNIFDLSNRLKTEQKKNADLSEELHGLKAKLLNYEVANSAPFEEITGQLKKELACSAQIDSNILSAVSDHSLSSISENQDVEGYKKSLTRQKTQTKQLLCAKDLLEKQKLSLEQMCNNLQQKLNDLQNVLDKERIILKQTQIEDVKLIEQLRIRLDAALDMQDELERVLGEEKHCRRALEVQLEELKKTGSTSSESTKYKSLPSVELMHLRKELDQTKEEKNKLIVELKSLKQDKNELENNVKYTKEMLMLEAERTKTYEEKFRMLSEKEKNLTDELLRKRFELECKEREVEEKKIKMDELEQEKTLLKKQKSDLLKTLKSQPSVVNPFDAVVPEALENVIKELKEKTDENKRTLGHIEKIEIEKKQLEDQLRKEMINNTNNNLPFGDLVARCNYLFAKALKLESVKKALIWQKRYLVDYLQSHQRHCLIEVLPNQPHENNCLRHRHSPLQHFRAAVYVVISIERMKFLVKRWQSGIRKSERINARHYERSMQKYLQENPGATAKFQVGQPVSNQNFSQGPIRISTANNPFAQSNMHTPIGTSDESRPMSPCSVISTIRDTPWSGSTPPSKDVRSRNKLKIGSNILTREDMTPLRAPQLLAQFQERFDQIHEKLGFPYTRDTT